MSRTAGMMNFLKPIVPKYNKSKMKGEFSKDDETNEWQSEDENDSEAEDDIDFDIIEDEEGVRRKRKMKGKKGKKKFVDLRHPSEEIYLQRI